MSDTKGEERHIKSIEETETEVTITFGKSKAEIDGEETAGWQKDKEKYREARPAQQIETRAKALAAIEEPMTSKGSSARRAFCACRG